MYFIGLGNDRDTKINPSGQFHFKKLRKCCDFVRILNGKSTKLNLLYD